MDIENLTNRVLAGEKLSTLQIMMFTSEQVMQLVDQLKAEADRHWRIDPNKTMHFASQIKRIGNTVGDQRIVALGTMVHGDALRFVHRNDEAWQVLNDAGELYRRADDEVGWARTRIGRLAICIEMNAMESGFQDAETARDIFRAHGEYAKLIRLESNAAQVLNYLCQYQRAIEKCHQVLELSEQVGGIEENFEVIVLYNLGYAYQGLGSLREALKYYQRTREIMVTRGEIIGIAEVDLNLVSIAQAGGHTKQALQLLHQIIGVLTEYQALEIEGEVWHLVECYFYLNRFSDAREMLRKVIQKHPVDHENYDLAQSLVQLAVANAALGDFSQVFELLQRAGTIFERLNATAWLGTVYLYRGRFALRQGDLPSARRDSKAAADQFNQQSCQISYLTALLLAIRVEMADGETESALQIAYDVRKMARRIQVPQLSYDAHLLLGKIAEQTGNLTRASRHFQAATAMMERIQRSLVVTSRVDFLADKQESIQALLRLHLAAGRTKAAFTALERAKAHVWLGYLSQLDQLRWLKNDAQTQPLIDELSRLREEHHWYYRAAYDQVFREQQHVVLPLTEAAKEAATRERRLRMLTEQLYLRSSMDDLAATNVVPTADIQQCLEDDIALVEYYSDGNQFWMFVMDKHHLDVCPLNEPVSTIQKLLDKWQNNVNRVLRTVPGSTDEQALRDYGLPILQRLYEALMAPFAEHLSRYRRLVIVPYGSLHYLPFQLLHDDQQYLIQRMEVVTLPAASLLPRPAPRQQRGALAIAYNWDGRLRHTTDEADRVVSRFGGRFFSEGEAQKDVLDTPPCQVLHITAHGQYRIDQPDFSYIQLADGPLYTDDLFQHDLSYELVTLSACETGRSHAAAGDELIGLGRGFFFAGAGAIIASMWRVNESLTLELMEELYRQLDSGASKAAAMRDAQLVLMRAYPRLHPAFWGAFQLIGNADPLTSSV
jgi:CHAT domain-containing protein